MGIVPIIDHQAFIVHDAEKLRAIVSSLSSHCTITLYVSQGEAHWIENGESILLTRGDMLIHNMKRTSYEIIACEGFAMLSVCVSSDYSRQFAQSIKISWKIRQALITHALFHLSHEDRNHVIENYDFLMMKCQGKDNPQRTVILKHLLHVLSIEMLLRIECYIHESAAHPDQNPHTGTRDIELGHATSAQNIFNRFTSMLEQTPVRNRPVTWWASRVNVSAKYLSAICREVDGKSARTLIAESVVLEANRLLQNPNLSIKEISDRLGFANQSHFGTFYKRHTGHSPIKKNG